MYKREVLRTYRRIFQIARTWEAVTAGSASSLAGELQTKTERDYIKQEARKLFRKNKDVILSLILEIFISPVCITQGFGKHNLGGRYTPQKE